MKTEK